MNRTLRAPTPTVVTVNAYPERWLELDASWVRNGSMMLSAPSCYTAVAFRALRLLANPAVDGVLVRFPSTCSWILSRLGMPGWLAAVHSTEMQNGELIVRKLVDGCLSFARGESVRRQPRERREHSSDLSDDDVIVHATGSCGRVMLPAMIRLIDPDITRVSVKLTEGQKGAVQRALAERPFQDIRIPTVGRAEPQIALMPRIVHSATDNGGEFIIEKRGEWCAPEPPLPRIPGLGAVFF